MDQIVRVLPPGDAQGPVTPTYVQATPSRTLIEARLKRYVVEDRQKGRPKYTGAYHKLTVDGVLSMISAAHKKCVVCDTDLLFQGYTKCHGQTWSIDRLDDSQGHYRWNIRLTCLSCNRRHKRVYDDETIDPNSYEDLDPLDLSIDDKYDYDDDPEVVDPNSYED